ncbi:hypothetical protein BKA93DRAFT_824901 [Sparassis latifolia]
MAQLQDLSRSLLAAGGAMHPEGKGTYLLYTDDDSLISKLWTGTEFDESDLIATSIRTGSPASYLLTDDIRLVVCITSDNTVRVLRYDKDEEEWTDDDTIPRYEVHSAGQLAACLGVDGRLNTFFQDTSGRLIFLDESWNPTVLPVDVQIGSPIALAIVEKKGDAHLYVFYVSKDNRVHFVAQDDTGSWSDSRMVNCQVEEKVVRFRVALNEQTDAFEAYALTDGRTVLQITGKGDGQKNELGKIDQDGVFVPGTSAECAVYVWVMVRVVYPCVRYCCW